MVVKSDVYIEMSKRVDHVEEEIGRIREKIHDQKSESGAIVMAMKEMDNTLTSVFENQKNLSQKFIDLKKDNDEKLHAQNNRITETEKTTMHIKFVSSQWKTLLIVCIFFACLGFAFDNGMKDILHAFLPDSVAKAAKVMTNG